MSFFDDPLTKTVKSNGSVLDRSDIGLKISIPEGAVHEEKDAEINVFPCFSGPFKMPEGFEAASPVYMIGEGYKFKKDVKLEIEHFADIQSKEECETMVLVKASPKPKEGSDIHYILEKVEHSEKKFIAGEQTVEIICTELQPGLIGTAKKERQGNS